MVAALEDQRYRQSDGPLQDYQRQRYAYRYGAGAYEYFDSLVPALGAEGLCREAAGAHAQEAEVPVYEVEYLGAYGYGANMVAREVAHDGHIHHAEERHGDVGHYVGQSEAQDASVHRMSHWAQPITRCVAASHTRATMWLLAFTMAGVPMV